MNLFQDAEAREKLATLEKRVADLADIVRQLNESLGGALDRIEALERAKERPRSHFTR
jgi:hypothetical protein